MAITRHFTLGLIIFLLMFALIIAVVIFSVQMHTLPTLAATAIEYGL